jgi:proline iminopeptidase
MADALRTLYPELAPNRTGFLPVGGGHEIYFEESGNSSGKPVVFLHGGPGGGTEPKHRRYFDPARYRIVLVDQRGCGKSTPFASLEENTTWHLVADLEAVRTHLAIERWMVFGGSWGSTLALAYAQAHPQRVTELVLRGIFLLRRRELEWFYQGGAAAIFPDAWEEFVAPIPPEERHNLMEAYYKRLTGPDEELRQTCARAWSIWEGSTITLRYDRDTVARFGGSDFALAFARIECHYFVHGGFVRSDQQLLEDVGKIRHIPATIVHGRYDVVCPLESAWALHRAWPEASLEIVPAAGHAASEPGIVDALIRATDAYAR